MGEPSGKQTFAAWAWVPIAVLACFELAAHPRFLAAIPSDADWAAAAAFVRARHAPSDRIVAVPEWVDPIVRHELGDLSTLRAAAPPDSAGFDGVWELGIRGATTRDDPPALERTFGKVRVRRWPLQSARVRYDFVESLSGATVELQTSEGVLGCPRVRGRPGRGGLERGPMRPAERFVCDRARPWLWVGATVLTDLTLQPRRCIWQHPAGEEPVRTTFEGVPLDRELVVHAGLDYQVERREARAPVTLRVFVDDALVGSLVHDDGDGWSELRIDTSGYRTPARVRFETTTPDPTARWFCYAASVQTGGPR